jgi:hypothetical protein
MAEVADLDEQSGQAEGECVGCDTFGRASDLGLCGTCDAKVANTCAKVLESEWAFGIWSHRRAPGWASDVLTAGLVLDDDHPEAGKLRSWGLGYLIRNYFRSRRHNGGAWLHDGSSYNVGLMMPKVIARPAGAAKGPDSYDVIRRNYGDWLQGHADYLLTDAFPTGPAPTP